MQGCCEEVAIVFANENMVFLGLALSFVFFVISVLAFIRLDIYTVVCSLTGITAKREIKKIRENNCANGPKGYKSSAVNLQRGKITIPLGLNGEPVSLENIQKQHTSEESENLARTLNRTENLNNQESAQQSGNQTTVLATASPEMQNDGYQTTVLYQEDTTASSPQGCAQYSPFQMELDETVTHTDETI